ncbi:polysaccharide deacetylase family protein [Alteromonas sp. 5E99-2]|uniref:polysaccharide deacetylase family protein n=1 Tax=Alteromonas sp. 5E99-2 TaxID=2817683 RepID=UPI001A996E96|nr:polysaccharide deacetylase family protein [Alteromonas sp. 5E99-2]MBO1254790.1 polysaccharide deacetylase family protein [Alteromonas sp. 5E99-2]
MKTALFFLMSFFSFSVYSEDDRPNKSAVILVYHHVSTATPPSTSVSPAVFREHMAYITANHTVIDTKTLVEGLRNNLPLPDNAVVITFDDGYNNILENAHPILSEMALPYTVFINPARIGNEKNQLTWAQVKQMHSAGVTFTNHTLDHLHMLDRVSVSTSEQWLDSVWSNVKSAQRQLEDKLGDTVPRWLAYPFGEYNESLSNLLKQEGYIGFAQHSGAVSSSSNLSALPRFPAAGIYANLNTLKTKMKSLALPITHTTPTDPERTQGDKIHFSVEFEPGDIRTHQFQCFYKGNKIEHSLSANVLKIETQISLPVGRSRVNCTAPSKSQNGRYYWYSQPFFLARSDGTYPD